MKPQQPGLVVPRYPHARVALIPLVVGVGFLFGIPGAPAAPVDPSLLPHVGSAPPALQGAADSDVLISNSERGEAETPRLDARGIAIDQLPMHRSDPSAKASKPLRVVTHGELARGESLGSALGAQGISASVIHVVAREMRPVFDFRRCQPGDTYRLEQDPQGSIIDFKYASGPDESFHLWSDGDSFEVQRVEADLTPRVARLAGVVQTSLYESIRSLGENPQLASDFAGLFAWDIDFSRSVQPGDDFKILYERLYRTDMNGAEEYVRPGRILAARYRGLAGDHTAVYFENEEGNGTYYRGDGSSIEREFLVAPLRFSRISSNFTSARRHPILNVTRPHHGIDYAAPSGTDVWAVADGTVIHRGWGGGFGNLVKIRHADGYVSYYAHLSRFQSKLRVGQKVKQKQVIGYVGKTGLATGPHVCFRVAKDGHYVNPYKLERPAGEPVPDERWVDFQIVRDSLLDELDGHTMIATDEAL